MDVAVILTYRCDSKCAMCYAWRHPSLPAEEVSPQTLSKLPNGIDHLNLTGGEPTLRHDLPAIVDLLYPKARTFEVSSNGQHAERLEPIINKYPNLKIRFSLDGSEATNNRIRGEANGYHKKVAGLLRLKQLGGRDLGFGVTIQDDNAAEVVDLFHLAQRHGFELATTTLHNGFQFHKPDNFPYDRRNVAQHIERLIVEMLRTQKMKNWFRAYLTLGLLAKVLGNARLLPCAAGSDFAFVDPWADLYACNVRPDLRIGNLETQTWDEIITSPASVAVQQQVYACGQNCWMVGSARTAMRNPKHPKLPRSGPLRWVIINKLKVTLGMRIDFRRYVDYTRVPQAENAPRRPSFLDTSIKKRIQTRQDAHYVYLGEFINR